MKRSIRGLAAALIVVIIIAAIISYIRTNNLSPDSDEGVQYLIGISQPNVSEPWRVVMNEEIRSEVAKNPEMKVIFTDAAHSSEQQANDVNKLLDYGVDLLIVSLDDPNQLTSVVTEAYKKIPVIVLGRGVTGYDYSLYIGTDNENIGRQAGKMAGEKLKAGGRIIEIQGLSGSPTVEERSKGFREELSRYQGLDIAYTLNGDWQRDKAEDEMNSLLARKLNDFDLVFAQNDAMALGAIRALEGVGRKDVPVIGIDGVNSENGGIPLVKEEKMAGTLTSPTGGKEAVQYALDILKKEKVIPKKIILRSHRITQETVEDFLRGFRDGKLPVSKTVGEKIVLGFAQVGTESSWRLANTKSVLSAAEAAGINIKYKNAEQSQDRQIAIIRQFIAEKVDVIAFSPKVETGWEEVLNEAKLAGIPVIFMDRQARVEDTLFTSYIGSDFIEEGRRAARWLNQEAGSANHTIHILELQGTEKSAPALGRKVGFEQVIADLPQFQMIESLLGDFTEVKGKQLMAEALRKYGKQIDVVYAHNDDMALGAIDAIEEYGLRPGKDIILLSVDATERAFKAMVAGKLNLAVECNPLLGPQLMKAVNDLMEGKELPTQIITSESVFPRETAKQYISEREY